MEPAPHCMKPCRGTVSLMQSREQGTVQEDFP